MSEGRGRRGRETGREARWAYILREQKQRRRCQADAGQSKAGLGPLGQGQASCNLL